MAWTLHATDKYNMDFLKPLETPLGIPLYKTKAIKPCQLINMSLYYFAKNKFLLSCRLEQSVEFKNTKLVSTCLFYFTKNRFLSTRHLEQSAELKHIRNKQLTVFIEQNTLVQRTYTPKQRVKKCKRFNCAK